MTFNNFVHFLTVFAQPYWEEMNNISVQSTSLDASDDIESNLSDSSIVEALPEQGEKGKTKNSLLRFRFANIQRQGSNKRELGAQNRKQDERTHLARTETKAVNGLKFLLLAMMLLVGIVMAVTTYRVTKHQEVVTFETQFAVDASRRIDSYYQHVVDKMWIASTMIQAYDTSMSVSLARWPSVSLPDYDMFGVSILHLLRGKLMIFSTLLTKGNVHEWEGYATRMDSALNFSRHSTEHSVADGIWRFREEDLLVSPDPVHNRSNMMVPETYEDEFYSPVWQITPLVAKGEALMFNQFTEKNRRETLETVMRTRRPALSGFLDDKVEAAIFNKPQVVDPRSLRVFPIFGNTRERIVGFLSIEVRWQSFFAGMRQFNEPRPIDFVVENTCGQQHTFEIKGREVVHLGVGDKHDKRFDHLRQSTTEKDFLLYWEAQQRDIPLPDGYKDYFQGGDIFKPNDDAPSNCEYTLHFYPTRLFQESFLSSGPQNYTIGVVCMSVFTIIIFVVYDCVVQRRQHVVMKTAVRCFAIVSSLFPPRVRDRLMGPPKQTSRTDDSNTSGDETGAFDESRPSRMRLRTFLRYGPDDHSDAAADPSSNLEPIAEMFPDVTVVFADIAGFTAWSSEREPHQVFMLLETLYRAFDKAANRLGGESLCRLHSISVPASTRGPSVQGRDHRRLLRGGCWTTGSIATTRHRHGSVCP